jgi:hypothetical protein
MPLLKKDKNAKSSGNFSGQHLLVIHLHKYFIDNCTVVGSAKRKKTPTLEDERPLKIEKLQ